MTQEVHIDMKAARVIVAEELDALRLAIISNMQRAGEVASGRTIDSLHVESTEQEGTLFGRAYFGVLETGRKGGRVPRGFAQIIYKWMQDKGVHADPIPYVRTGAHKYSPQERGDRSMAAAIAAKIRKEGTRLYRTGGRADIYSNEIPRTVERIRKRLVFLISQAITSIPLNRATNIGGK